MDTASHEVEGMNELTRNMNKFTDQSTSTLSPPKQ